jgi:hypothetical protein
LMGPRSYNIVSRVPAKSFLLYFILTSIVSKCAHMM